MSSKHGYAAALGLLVVCGLGGCSGGGDDPPATGSGSPGGAGTGTGSPTTRSAPTPSTTASPSTTATTPAVQIPAAARTHTEEGAEAFVRFFMDQVSRAWTTPMAGLVSPLGEVGCVSCKSFEETAVGLVNRSEKYEARPSTTISAQAVPGGGSRQLVHLILQQHKVDVVNRNGETVLTDQRKRFAVNVELSWEKGRWWVHDMG